MPSKKIEEVEILRAFAILAVIAIHVITVESYGLLLQNSGIRHLVAIVTGVNIFVHFGVPLFVLISGFVLGLNYRNSFSLTDYYRKRLLSIIPAYIIFSFRCIKREHQEDEYN